MRREFLFLSVCVLLLATACGTGTGGPLIAFPPSLSSVSPPSGPTGGGTVLTLTGTNFTPLMTVTVAGTLCLDINVNPLGTSLTCTTLGGTAGAKDVRVETVTGSATLPGAFTYIPALSAKPLPVVDLAVLDGEGLPLALWSDVLRAAGDEIWCALPSLAADGPAILEYVEAGGYLFGLDAGLGVLVWYDDPAAFGLGQEPAGCLGDERLRAAHVLFAVER